MPEHFVRIRGKVIGPFTHAHLQTLYARGKISRVHEISDDGRSWRAVGDELIQIAPPPPPPPVMSPPPRDADQAEFGIMLDPPNIPPPMSDSSMMSPTFCCPFCHAQSTPNTATRVSQAGWTVFVILLMFTLIFFWIGLLIRERYRECTVCGMRIGIAR